MAGLQTVACGPFSMLGFSQILGRAVTIIFWHFRFLCECQLALDAAFLKPLRYKLAPEVAAAAVTRLVVLVVPSTTRRDSEQAAANAQRQLTRRQDCSVVAVGREYWELQACVYMCMDTWIDMCI